jgi:hypothetical protein
MFCSVKALHTAALCVVAIATSLIAGQARATTIPFDFSGNTTTSSLVLGTTGGTMSFTLDLGDPGGVNVFGNFAMDIFNSSSVLIGEVNFGGINDGTTVDYGNITGTSVTDSLRNVSLWSVTVGAADLPSVSFVITSTLDSFDGTLNPVLTVDFSGDLQLAPAAVPGPVVGSGPLAAFVFGATLLFLTRQRWARRMRTGAASPALHRAH